ncbi:hypothetical protein [Clostridium sp. UBA1056]|uniref:hypothetical protein n=1 Tax=unclassified Clostridium TaxID=2614128 RepID=UPI0032163A8C
MKKTIISLSLVICMALGLGAHNLGINTGIKDDHKNNTSIIVIEPLRGPGECEPK